MNRNPVLDLPLTAVLRSEIALPLQCVAHIYTVGNLLRAWGNPHQQKRIEQVFQTPQQARHAVAVCATWLGMHGHYSVQSIPEWWSRDDRPTYDA